MIVRNTNPYENFHIDEKSKVRIHGSHLYLLGNVETEFYLSHMRCPAFYDNCRRVCEESYLRGCIGALEERYPELIQYTNWLAFREHNRVGFKLLAHNMSMYEYMYLRYNYKRLNRILNSSDDHI